jgi:hypothetical protein
MDCEKYKKDEKEYTIDGQKLYELYNELGNEKYRWKNYMGKPTPQWEELGEPQKMKWTQLALFLLWKQKK